MNTPEAMRDLTVLILTWNEQDNIGRTLSALDWVPKILIVDSFSTDGTGEIARRFPQVEIVQRPFDSHTSQWNFGLSQVTTTWVLTLDADYELSPALAAEIQQLKRQANLAYAAPFQLRVFGHPLRASAYPPRTVLFPRDLGRYIDDGHTQLLECKAPVQMFQNVIYHDDRKPLSRWIRAQDRYAALEARHLMTKPYERLNRQDRLRTRIYFAPIVMLLYLCFARLLIFGGWPAWYYIFQRVIAEALLSLRLLTEREHLENGPDSTGERG